jgi:hypothetical protein
MPETTKRIIVGVWIVILAVLVFRTTRKPASISVERGFWPGSTWRLETKPGYAEEIEPPWSGILFTLKEDMTWHAWQTDYNNSEGCSWGAKSGVARGSWKADEGVGRLKIDNQGNSGSPGPLHAWDGAQMVWINNDLHLTDNEGREFVFKDR